MLLAAEPPPSMEKSSNVHPKHLPRSTVTPRKEERASMVPPRSHRPKASTAGLLPEASPGRKERPQKEKRDTNEVKSDQETEVKLKTTVVDIDKVRDDEVKEENLGLLEAAEQEDGLKRKNLGVFEWLLMVFMLALVLLFLPLSSGSVSKL
ncbi:hypothetical protein Q5P01_015796 [Channa striata]|uniref:Uncharacterized protein n=1 Tax=Channa striata TaxID=64152 RepID=A0AA88MFE5_CHASR|nr:hypothetical protein Q5P01_015796 [Channa striata]